jgi:hypothetical protein
MSFKFTKIGDEQTVWTYITTDNNKGLNTVHFSWQKINPRLNSDDVAILIKDIPQMIEALQDIYNKHQEE